MPVVVCDTKSLRNRALPIAAQLAQTVAVAGARVTRQAGNSLAFAGALHGAGFRLGAVDTVITRLTDRYAMDAAGIGHAGINGARIVVLTGAGTHGATGTFYASVAGRTRRPIITRDRRISRAQLRNG